MPRNKRIEIPGIIHHVIVRGLERRKIFIDNKDYETFIDRLRKSLSSTSCLCYAWALIPNHFHLLIKTGLKPLTSMMRSLLTGYAVYFNRRHNRHGYLYQNRYKSTLCQEDRYFKKLISYIHLNPLKAKVVKTLAELDTYPWSGHSVLIGKKHNDWQSEKEALSCFDTNLKTSRLYYRSFIEQNAESILNMDFTGGGLKRSAGGWEKVKLLKNNKVSWRGDERILGEGEFVDQVLKLAEEQLDHKESLYKAGWNFKKLIAHICILFSLKEDILIRKGRNNHISQAKSLLCYWGHIKLGISGAELSRYLGISRQAVYKNIALGEVHSKGKELS